MLLRLLAAALTPLVRQTHAWIASGVLHDPASEFFIIKGENFPTLTCLWSTPELTRSVRTALLLCHHRRWSPPQPDPVLSLLRVW